MTCADRFQALIEFGFLYNFKCIVFINILFELNIQESALVEQVDEHVHKGLNVVLARSCLEAKLVKGAKKHVASKN